VRVGESEREGWGVGGGKGSKCGRRKREDVYGREGGRAVRGGLGVRYGG